IEKNGEWILENLTDKDHIRGAFKAYRKACFEQIGNLKPAMGWDTVDELLCKFYHWKVVTNESLIVKHLKPTGANYNKTARYKQGEAFYTLGYGFVITSIASLKLAMRKGKPLLFIDYIQGFLRAKASKTPLLVTTEQAEFIRKYRLKKMKQKLFG
ncbi:MAG: glycosyltransferase family 2 protein, partial [Flavobacterium sp.]